jgi:hypothetical protein
MRSEIKAAATPDNNAIFGMESVSDWSTTTSGAVLAQSSTHSQGSYALSVRPSNSNGYTPIKSVAMSTLATVSPTLSVDVMLPTYQPNPNWLGTAQAYIDCPSRNINSQFLNQVELTGKPLNVWNTINFSLTNSWVSSLLQTGYSDLRITVVLNVQVPTTGIYYIDNLRFSPVAANGCGGLPNGTSCTDNNACTLGDTCQSGTCHSGSLRSCDASDQCHDAGTCNPTTGLCSNPPKAEKTPCNDSDACTQTDYCVTGECKGFSPIGCTASDQCHDVGTCDHTTGECSDPPKQNDLPCDDNNACTEGDTCQGGHCQGGSTKNCPASDQCHVGVCDTVSGECGTEVAALGTSCDDGNNCTTDDACQGGTCAGSGSGFVGPGEQCAPATPGTPGPFGDFHCLLEEVPGTDKNALTIGTGTLASTWILRGTMDFSFTASEAKLTKLSATGQQSRLSLQNGIVLMRDPSVASSGTVGMTSGNVQVSLPMLVRGSSGASMPLSLSLTGQIADRVLQGEATAPGGAGGRVKLFCREQFRNTVASATFQLDSTGNFAALGPITIFDGTPSMPGLRSIPASGDLIAELVSVTGEILDQYSVGQPWLGSRAGDVLAPTDSSGIFNLQVRAPLSNRLGAVILRDSTGTTLAMANLTQSITDFCAGTGSQFCDYRTGTPVRTVLYTPHITPRILTIPPPTSENSNQRLPLPASPRLVEVPFSVTNDATDRQPSVALDADGNAVVIWRHDDDIMAEGIAKDGTITFGPTKVNDVRCVKLFGLPESATSLTQRPKVVRTTRRDSNGNADGTFVVGWSGFTYELGFICARVMNSDGTPATDPISVTTAEAPIDALYGYFDLAMTASHSFMVTWASQVTGDPSKVYAQGFSENGAPKLVTGNPAISNPLVVASDSSSSLKFPTVALDGNGNAVIAWLKASEGSSKGVANMQRFKPDMGKLGSVITVPANNHSGIPDVALTYDGSRIMITGHTTSNTIWASIYDFTSGNSVFAPFQVNARQGGWQRSPILVNADSGEFLVAWVDDVGVDSGTGFVISAQIFSQNGVPEDIDFTASTESPIDITIADLAFEGFRFDAAASANNYAVVWQTASGISMQRITGGPASCPAPNDCGTAVPLRITGGTDDSVDIVLSPGVDVDYNDRTAVKTWLTPKFSSTSEFARTAVDMIVNGYWANSVFSKYANKLNFYYDMSQSYETNHFEGYICYELVAGQNGIQFNGNTAFTDVGVIVMKDYEATKDCTEIDTGLADLRDNANSIFTGSPVAAMVHHPNDYSTLIHESGHATFGLREEYHLPGAKGEDFGRHSNVFNSQEFCKNYSKQPDKCSAIEGANNLWKSDPDAIDAMSGGDGNSSVYYGPDCQQMAQCWIEDIGCD